MHHLNMQAYSIDLREKIVAAVWRGMSKAQAARTFGVGVYATSLKVREAEELEGRIRQLEEQVDIEGAGRY